VPLFVEELTRAVIEAGTGGEVLAGAAPLPSSGVPPALHASLVARLDCVGELVQVDGCEHWWFEDRGPQCTLSVSIDDATSRLMHLQFVESEPTPVQARGRRFAYFHAARACLEAWGKPVAFYSDKHGVFRVNHPAALGGDGMTQFGRALHALNIHIICANSRQAKSLPLD
jgi:hypothetical protein